MNVQIEKRILPKFCHSKKSFNHPHHLKSRVPPPPPLLGANDYIADWYHKVDHNIGNEVLCNHLFLIKNYTVDIFWLYFDWLIIYELNSDKPTFQGPIDTYC